MRISDSLLAGELLGIPGHKRNDEMVPGHCRDLVEPSFSANLQLCAAFFSAKTRNSQNSPGNAKSFEIMYRLDSFSANLRFAAVRIK